MIEPNIHTAIALIAPEAEYSMHELDLTSITWHKGGPISVADIEAKKAELDAEYKANKYQRDRKSEYDLLNQFEMQFDDQRDGTSTWVDAINAIKDKYPKL